MRNEMPDVIKQAIIDTRDRRDAKRYREIIKGWEKVREDMEELPLEDSDDDPFHEQIGGSHYVGMAIQPIEYIHRNGLGFCEGLVIKYVSRWENKGGIEDLQKAIHTLQLLIDMEQEDGDD